MRRAIVLFLPALFLWELVAQCNHALAAAHVYLYVPALFVAYAALILPLYPGLGATLLAGLLCDAHAPVALGTHPLLLGLAHTAVFQVRERLPRDHTVGRVAIAVLLNLALFLAFSFTQIGDAPAPAALWPRLLADLAGSQIFLALVAPWFFALQARTLQLFGGEERLFA
jgi:hypothetical protein